MVQQRVKRTRKPSIVPLFGSQDIHVQLKGLIADKYDGQLSLEEFRKFMREKEYGDESLQFYLAAEVGSFILTFFFFLFSFSVLCVVVCDSMT